MAHSADDVSRVLAFINASPGRSCYLAVLAQRCPIASAAGRPGAYGKWFRDHADLFELSGPVVRVRQAGTAPYAAGVARDEGCAVCRVPKFSSDTQHKEHLVGRKHLANVKAASRAALRPAAPESTAPLPAAASPPAAPTSAGPPPVHFLGCKLCCIPHFSTAKQRDEHLVSEVHREGLYSALGIACSMHTKGGSKEGSTRGSAAKCDVEPGKSNALMLELQNEGKAAWELKTLAQLRPLSGFKVDLPPTGSRRLDPKGRLRFSAEVTLPESGMFRTLVVVGLERADRVEGEANFITLTCDVEFRCASAQTAKQMASLAPTSPYAKKRPQRPRMTSVEPGPRPPPVPGAPPPFPVIPDPPADATGRNAVLASLSTTSQLGPDSHARRFKSLLFVEESAAREALSSFDLEPAILRHTAGGGPLLRLQVSGLAEGRPSLLRGDTVVIYRRADKKGIRGRIETVERDAVLLAFSRRVVVAPGDVWSAHFELSRSTFRRQHAALEPGWAPPAAVLFPGPPIDAAEDSALARAVLDAKLPHPPHNANLNEPQRRAVCGALYRLPGRGTPAQPPFIVFGPPGTGKTSTLAEYVCQVISDARRRGLRPGAASRDASSAGAGRDDGGGVGELVSRVSRLHLDAAPERSASVLVLVTAPSNSATDELALRLLKPRGVLEANELIRANGFMRDRDTVPKELAASCRWNDSKQGYTLPGRDDLKGGVWVVAATCSTAQRMLRYDPEEKSRGQGAYLPASHAFSHVIVDEAGQATEPECLCSLSGALCESAAPGSLSAAVSRGGLGAGRIVLAGDPHQLGPVLQSKEAAKAGLGLSLLDRLMGTRGGPHTKRDSHSELHPLGFHPAFVVKLTHNYRSHSALLAVPNELFYDGALVPNADPSVAHRLVQWAGLTPRARSIPGGFPLLFHGVSGEDVREGNSPSWFNPLEAAAVVEHITSILAHGVSTEEIGVVTPYHKQARKITKLLNESGIAGVTVGSVEVFQGRERPVIIVSAVRSSTSHVEVDAQHALGFLSNAKRFNVAVTRAQSLLVVVGNPSILARDASWRALLDHAVRNGAYRGVELPPGIVDSDSGGSSPDSESFFARAAAEAATVAASGDRAHQRDDA